MKRNNIIKRFASVFVFFACTFAISAQATIGSGEAPSEGAVLQLKNIDNITDGSVNATKGMILPRVELTDLGNLMPMFSSDAGYTGSVKTAEDKNHMGMLVYNTKENLTLSVPIYKGVYVWTGSSWELVIK